MKKEKTHCNCVIEQFHINVVRQMFAIYNSMCTEEIGNEDGENIWLRFVNAAV